MRLLGVDSLSLAANPSATSCSARGLRRARLDGVELLLKGGQVGADNLFIDVAALGAAH